MEKPCCEGCWVTQSKVKPPTEVTKMCRCPWDTEDVHGGKVNDAVHEVPKQVFFRAG